MIKDIFFRDYTVRYRKEGTGPALVLLHGFCESLGIWNDFTRALSKKYLLIVPDLPGHGGSGGPEISTMEFMAEAVHAVLREESVKSAVLTGHSMGGYVSLAFAELFPEEIKGLCLFHSTAVADTQEKKLGRTLAMKAAGKDPGSFMSALIPKLFAPPEFSSDPALREKYIALSLAAAGKMPAKAIIAALAGMRDRKDRQQVLKNASFPVLFIIGKNDALIPVESILPQTLLPRHAEALLLEKAGHMGFFEAKEETLSVLEGFTGRCF